MCTGTCRDRRYSRRQVGKGVLGASMAGAMMSTPWSHSALAKQANAEVTWWTEPDDLEFKQALVIDPFQQEHPDITIVMEAISGEDRDRVISTALQAGAGPDIVPSSGPAHAGTLSQAGLLLELDSYASEFGWGEERRGDYTTM